MRAEIKKFIKRFISVGILSLGSSYTAVRVLMPAFSVSSIHDWTKAGEIFFAPIALNEWAYFYPKWKNWANTVINSSVVEPQK